MDYGLGIWAVVLSITAVVFIGAGIEAWYAKRHPPIIRPEVGGCWKINTDWNVRSRR